MYKTLLDAQERVFYVDTSLETSIYQTFRNPAEGRLWTPFLTHANREEYTIKDREVFMMECRTIAMDVRDAGW